jgi:uncharacterized membrane protein YgdD (TMEM256/DUF423 family)
MYHALALVLVGVLATVLKPNAGIGVAGWGFLLGSLLFSGSLYAITLSGIRAFGLITPLGGVAFLVGWCGLAWAAFAQQVPG